MALDAHLVELSEKHRQLDRKIEEEMARPTADDLKIAELKRQKLRLKDEIERLKHQMSHSDVEAIIEYLQRGPVDQCFSPGEG